jgi:hypothetical protein
MTKRAALGKIFHQTFIRVAFGSAFQNACLRYVDKWLAKRSFLRLFLRVTLAATQTETFIQGLRCAGFRALAPNANHGSTGTARLVYLRKSHRVAAIMTHCVKTRERKAIAEKK